MPSFTKSSPNMPSAYFRIVDLAAMLDFLEEDMKKLSFQLFSIVIAVGLGVILALNYVFFGQPTSWSLINEKND